ncbi:hypothetical protein G9P44_001492 [Scheffersomyces stipitis]|nr:hypothetical protein G9P44_001492 [Scheffersomyces stipitis]
MFSLTHVLKFWNLHNSKDQLIPQYDHFEDLPDLRWVLDLPHEIILLILKELSPSDLVVLLKHNFPFQDDVRKQIAKGPLYIDDMQCSPLAKSGRLRIGTERFKMFADKFPNLRFGKLVTSHIVLSQLHNDNPDANVLERADEIEIHVSGLYQFYSTSEVPIKCRCSFIQKKWVLAGLDLDSLPPTTFAVTQEVIPRMMIYYCLRSEQITTPNLPTNLKLLDFSTLTIDDRDVDILPQSLETLRINIYSVKQEIDLSHLINLKHLTLSTINIESPTDCIFPSKIQELELICPTFRDYESLEKYHSLKSLTIHPPIETTPVLFNRTSLPRNIDSLTIRTLHATTGTPVIINEFVLPPFLKELKIQAHGKLSYLVLPPSIHTLELRDFTVQNCGIESVRNLTLGRGNESMFAQIRESKALQSLTLYDCDLNLDKPVIFNSELKELYLNDCNLDYTTEELEKTLSNLAKLEVLSIKVPEYNVFLAEPLFNLVHLPQNLKVLKFESNPYWYLSSVDPRTLESREHMNFCILADECQLPPKLEELEIVSSSIKLTKGLRLPTTLRHLSFRGFKHKFKFSSLTLPPYLETLDLSECMFNLANTKFPSTLREFDLPDAYESAKPLNSTNLATLDWINLHSDNYGSINGKFYYNQVPWTENEFD